MLQTAFVKAKVAKAPANRQSCWVGYIVHPTLHNCMVIVRSLIFRVNNHSEKIRGGRGWTKGYIYLYNKRVYIFLWQANSLKTHSSQFAALLKACVPRWENISYCYNFDLRSNSWFALCQLWLWFWMHTHKQPCRLYGLWLYFHLSHKKPNCIIQLNLPLQTSCFEKNI